ncbi:MAG: hypothetical protein U0Q22_12215 [Acidimicrobiales bacterium]
MEHTEIDHATATDLATVERTVLLEAGIDEVLDALQRPDLLSAWLGPWTPDADGTGATVTTDDGVTRRVTLLDADGTGAAVRWAWSPVDDPAAASEVRLVVSGEGLRTRVTVVESLPTATACTGRSVATAVPWLPSLLALGAVLAVGSHVPA